MIRFFFLLAAFSCTLTASAQSLAMASNVTAAPAATEVPAVLHRQQPTLPTAAGSFAAFLAEHLVYPELARDYAVEGTVVLEVKVSATGEATYVRTVKSLFAPLDEAAIDVVAELPRFLPAVRKGKAVAHTLMVPIRFSLR